MATGKIKTISQCAALALCSALLLCYSQGSRDGAAQGVKLCLNVLAPSLFPFMALTNLFAQTGLSQRLGKRLNRFTRAVFGVSGATAPVLIMSLIGGYPVGAAGISELRRQNAISEGEASRAALFSVCAGPGFIVSFVGVQLYQSRELGLIIYAAQAASVLLTAILARILFGKADYNSVAEINTKQNPFSQAFVSSVYSAARSMLMICAFVLLFSAVMGVLGQMLSDKDALTALSVLLEVCGASVRLSEGFPVEWTAFAIGFGGLCVHCQILASLGGIKVSKTLFFVFRIIQGLVTAALTHFGLRLLPQKAEVFSTATAGEAAIFGGSVLSGAALLGVMICFLISVKQVRSERLDS